MIDFFKKNSVGVIINRCSLLIESMRLLVISREWKVCEGFGLGRIYRCDGWSSCLLWLLGDNLS